MNPNELRTKWASLAGVKYPEATKPAREKRTRKAPVYTNAPAGPDPAKWISAPEAAELLGYRKEGICSILARRKLEKVLIYHHRRRRAYYLRTDVEAMAEKGLCCPKMPAGYVGMTQAAKALHVSTRVIGTMIKRGFLAAKRLEGVKGGYRVICRVVDLADALDRYRAARPQQIAAEKLNTCYRRILAVLARKIAELADLLESITEESLPPGAYQLRLAEVKLASETLQLILDNATTKP